ncbi:hypothetical protein VFPBJ_10543 [Purpureocillium lilacinum]|uniref:Uncharacterized protein n=1 Tax=Purpureocillium lilacinum TaxID=33203 RepID=A0A179G1M2_PURLI|nr:hypothetical protein VFPBJ_10543 [Purpureocillium lilacinum]
MTWALPCIDQGSAHPPPRRVTSPATATSSVREPPLALGHLPSSSFVLHMAQVTGAEDGPTTRAGDYHLSTFQTR